MSLTVPMAGTTAGRSASLAQFVEPDRTPEAVAGFGRAVAELGTGMEDERLSRELQTANLDMTREMNALRLTAESIGDPDELQRTWTDGTAAIRAAYLGGDGRGGRVSARNRSAFEASLTSLQDSLGYQMGARTVGLRQSQGAATLMAWEQEASVAAAGVDATGRAALQATGRAQIEALVADGTLTPEQGQQRILALGETLASTAAARMADDPGGLLTSLAAGELDGLGGQEKERLRVGAEAALAAGAANGSEENRRALNGYAIELVDGSPEEFLDLAEQGLFASLPPETLSRHKVDARNALASEDEEASRSWAITSLAANPRLFTEQIDAGEFDGLLPADEVARLRTQAGEAVTRQEQALEAQAEQAAQKRQAAIGTRLGDVSSLFTGARGRAVAWSKVDDAWLSRPDVRAHPDYPRAMASISLYNEFGGLKAKTLAELRTMVAAEMDRGIAEGYEGARLEVLRTALAEAEAGWTKRPVEYARELGLAAPPLDLAADGQDLARGLAQRRALAQGLEKQGYVRRGTDAMFDAEEREALVAATGPTANPERRLALAQAAAAAGVPASEMSGDRVFRYAADALADGSIPAPLAGTILRGQAALAEGNFPAPTPVEVGPEAWTVLGDFFGGVGDGERRQQDALQAAAALYAGRGRAKGPGDTFAPEAMRQSLHEVLGGTGQINDGSGRINEGLWGDRPDVRGGLQMVGETLVLLPHGMNASEARQGLETLTEIFRDGEQAPAPGSRGFARPRRATMDDLRAAATNGDLPTAHGRLLSSAYIAVSTLRAVDEDLYVLVTDNGSGPKAIGGEDGQPWTFSLRALVAAAEK